MIVLAVLTNLTALQRILYTRRVTVGAAARKPVPAVAPKPVPALTPAEPEATRIRSTP
jgi:hypothetical protein